MATKRARITAHLAAVAVILLIAGVTLYYRYGRTGAPMRGAAAMHGDSAASAPSGPTITLDGPAPEPFASSTDRTRARATLQECLNKAERAAKMSWDGMCASLAQRNSERRDLCRQQGRTTAECQSLYAETPLQDCLLPHQTASSIAQAQQSAKSDCYQQFQTEMR